MHHNHLDQNTVLHNFEWLIAAHNKSYYYIKILYFIILNGSQLHTIKLLLYQNSFQGIKNLELVLTQFFIQKILVCILTDHVILYVKWKFSFIDLPNFIQIMTSSVGGQPHMLYPTDKISWDLLIKLEFPHLIIYVLLYQVPSK